ncbi:CEP41 protein, partial [Mionectes macconnelli]|nr:CEP41 protein [Mionectes macconnelli]
ADAEVAAGPEGKGNPEEPPNPVLFLNSTGPGESQRSTLQSVISGVGEMDIEKDSPKKEESQAKDLPYPDCPFLLLDVRDRDAYEQCHIVGAYSYPIATLSRTMNPYTNSILEYNSPLSSIRTSRTLRSIRCFPSCLAGPSRAGITWICVPTGLKVVAQKIPEGLITGTLPLSCQVPAPPGSSRRKTSPRVPATRAENKWRFSAGDLQKLKYYLAKEHVPLDTASRLSRGISSRDSKPASARSNPNLHGSNAGSVSSRPLSRTSLQNRPWK